MTSDLYNSLPPKEKAFFDALVMMYKEQCKTNLLLKAILQSDAETQIVVPE